MQKQIFTKPHELYCLENSLIYLWTHFALKKEACLTSFCFAEKFLCNKHVLVLKQHIIDTTQILQKKYSTILMVFLKQKYEEKSFLERHFIW